MVEQSVPAPSAGFSEDMTANNVAPLWVRYHQIVVKEPKALDAPFIWRWQDLEPLIDRAAREVTMEDAERRVLMLLNPVFEGKPWTTTNLFAGLQILLPGEFARVHRHTASAFRFILDGNSGATIVNGKRCEMLEGDLVLTPNWTWHEHINDGDQRVVWLDGLDLPLAGNLDAVFAENGPAGNFPPDASTMPDAAYGTGLVPANGRAPVTYSPRFRYPWTDVLDSLAAMPAAKDGTRKLRYVNPLDGGPVMSTLDCYVLDLAKGQETIPFRTTANAVCAVACGEGESRIGDTVHKWKHRDVFSVPHWNWTTHIAASDDTKLFMMTDREVLDRTGFLREEFG